ncbi:S-layer homology domain [Thermoanaerobacter sp. YS13]|uniref:S-layer homology domain-containing protein n=1 Tax=Thermoanaerobacter sp. YS13 TaxID=1511746 RepID=UPI0005733D31|nr:S-layer homology domain-containing protein [Thermoanaerobacter sp. YS13]KHO61732.1 S-layer homology domain [Thermoanaerobacter sp. YS13]
MRNLKKLIAVVLTFALVFSAMAVGFAATPFTDVKSDAPYASAVGRLYALGITQGMGDGTYGPDLTLTRAQMVTFIVRMLGLEQVAQAAASEPPAFTDIKGHWAVGYINVAKDLKITDGVGDGKFAPDAKLTYGQALAFAIRALGYTNVPWGVPTLAKAVELGLTAGINLGFNDFINRGQTAILLNTTLETPVLTGYDQYGKEILGSKLISKVANVDTYLIVATSDVDNTVPAGQVKVDAATLNPDGTYSFGYDQLINAGTVDFNKYLGEVVKVYSPKFGAPIAVDVVTTDIKTFTVTKGAPTVANGVYTFQDNGVSVGNIPVVIDGVKSTMSAVYGAIDNGSQVTLINNNGQAGYDYAIVTAATAGVTPWVVKNNVVAGAQYIDNMYPLVDNLGNAYKIVGAVTKATDIKAGDVIYYLPSASTPLPVIYVVRNSVTGTVSQVSVSNGTTTATINGTAYTVAPSVASSIKAGAQGTATLDKNNTIVAWTATTTPTTVTTNYGIVLSSQAPFVSPFSTKIQIAKTDGTTSVYDVVYANVYNVNNTSGKVYNGVANNDIVSYTVNSNGQIDSLSTIVPAGTPYQFTNATFDTTNISSNVLKINGTNYYVSPSTVILNATVNTSTYIASAIAPVKISDLQTTTYNVLKLSADQYNNLSLLILANMPAPTQAPKVVYVTGYSTVTTPTSTYTVLNVLENGVAKTYNATSDLTNGGTSTIPTGVCTLTLNNNGNVTAMPAPVTPLNGNTPVTITINYAVYGVTYTTGSALLDPNVVVIDATGTTPVVTGLANISSTAKVNLYTNSIGKVNLIVIVAKQ